MVQAKVFAQLVRGDAGLRIGKPFLRRPKIVSVFLIMIQNEIAQIGRQRHTSRLRRSAELRFYLLRHFERYRHAFRLREICGVCNVSGSTLLGTAKKSGDKSTNFFFSLKTRHLPPKSKLRSSFSPFPVLRFCQAR